MKNPNAVASVVAGGVAWVAQWFLLKYYHAGLSANARGILTVFTTSAVLYIGKDGLVGGLKRAFNTISALILGPVVTK